MRKLLLLGLIMMSAMLTACSHTSFRAQERYGALGHEPGWLLTIDRNRLRFVSSPATRLEVHRPRWLATPTGYRYSHKYLVAEISRRPCIDTKSGIAFEDRVVVFVGGASYLGCGGKRLPVLDR